MADAPADPPIPKIPAPKPPGKIAGFFKKILGWPGRLLRLSVPAKAAILVTLALVAIVLVAWIGFLTDRDSVPWRHSMTIGHIVAVCCLLALIPLVVYRGLKLWLEGDASRFPDLDFAWQAGINALARNGIDVASAPIFLILGTADERQERSLFDAAGLGLRIRGIPEGPAPLHWYASPDAIYLCCTEASWTSALAAFEDTRSLTDIAARLPSLESAAPLPAMADNGSAKVSIPQMQPVLVGAGSQPSFGGPSGGYLNAPSPAPAPVAVAPALPPPQPAPAPAALPNALTASTGDVRGTIMLDQYSSQLAALQAGGSATPAPASPMALAASAPQAASSPAPMQEDVIRGTMMLQSPFGSGSAPQRSLSPPPAAYPTPAPYAAPQSPAPTAPSYSPAHAPAYSGAATGQRSAAVVPPQDAAEQIERLHYVCQLLRRARQPLCPINGILTLLPMRLIQGSPREAEELQRAIRSDMRAIGRVLELRCPVTAMVVGMEEEPGFRELVRRVGRDRAAVQRFGQRYDVRSIATPEEMNALCAHVCGAFEDWVYTLFREQGALSRPGNTYLYGLLCKVRLTIKNRLAEILSGAFGYDPHQAADSPVLFSGCYFAAIGSTEDRQAFCKGVFNKLVEEQEQIEWTPRALRHQKRYRSIATVGLILDAALIATLAGMIIYRAFFRGQ